jgi:uncharacterized protein (DUF2062 family)
MIFKDLKDKALSLLKLHHSPSEVALGVAIGVFISMQPVYGLHTVLVIFAAFLIRRANIIAMFVGTNISLPPTVPFITWAGYNIGRLILVEKHPYLPCCTFKGFLKQGFWNFYYPLLIGSLLLGAICAIVFYFLTLIFMNIRKKAKQNA